MLNRNRNNGGYHLADHPQAELTNKEVNMLYDMAKILSLGVAAEEMQIQRFVWVEPAAGTTGKTFTTTIDQCKVIGGFARVSGVDADYDIDIGKTGDTDCFINDFNSGSSSDATKELPLDPTYLQDADDVILTINSNSNTGPITVEIVLLCMHDTQFEPTGAITTTKVLTKLDSGTTFLLDASGGAYSITLPALQEGLNFKFIIDEDTPTGIISITSPTANKVYGTLEQQADTNEDNRVACAGVTTVKFAVTCLKGDSLDVVCDGSFFYVRGFTSVQLGFTTA